MNAKELKELGITDDALIEKIIIAHGKDIESHKQKLEALAAEKDALIGQVAEANKQIEGFKDMKKPEEVDAAINEWKAQLEKAKSDSEAAVQSLKFANAFEMALRDAKAKSSKAVGALFDSTKLSVGEDGSLVGFKEQLDPIKTQYPDFFKSDAPQPELKPKVKVTTHMTPAPVVNPSDALLETLAKNAGVKGSDISSLKMPAPQKKE